MSARKAGQSTKPAGELEPFTARLTPEAKRKLQALAQIRGEPAYEVIEEGFWNLWKTLPSGQREASERLIQLVEEAREKKSS